MDKVFLHARQCYELILCDEDGKNDVLCLIKRKYIVFLNNHTYDLISP